MYKGIHFLKKMLSHFPGRFQGHKLPSPNQACFVHCSPVLCFLREEWTWSQATIQLFSWSVFHSSLLFHIQTSFSKFLHMTSFGAENSF